MMLLSGHTPAKRETMTIYRSPRWQRARSAFLSCHPTCQAPGCRQAATDVDHKVPVRQGGAPFDFGNLQALCKSCHSRKTAWRDGGFGNRARSGRPITPGVDASGFPMDPDHPFNRRQ